MGSGEGKGGIREKTKELGGCDVGIRLFFIDLLEVFEPLPCVFRTN